MVELVNENGKNETRKKFNRLNADIRTHQTQIRKSIESTHKDFLSDVAQIDDTILQCETLLERNSKFLNHLDSHSKVNVACVDDDVRQTQQV